MPLGRALTELRDDLRDRVEVSWHHDTWHVTAGSFEAALNYVNERFDDPVVLFRHDHGRRWTRVTLDVTTDPTRAPLAPSLDELAGATDPDPDREPPTVDTEQPVHPLASSAADTDDRPVGGTLPDALEAIFASQNPGHRAVSARSYRRRSA